MEEINLKDGQNLINIARKSIKTYLEDGKRISTPKVSEKLKKDMGAFVTLKKYDKSGEKRLRGCMGIPLPRKSLIKAVVDSSINSSTKDPRFPELSLDELEEIVIEVSVLSQPEKIEVDDRKKLPNQIKVGKNGLLMESSMGSGLLLPTVPIEHNWDEREFLEQTCKKAGLRTDCWKDNSITVKKFSGIVFAEKSPNGEVDQIFGEKGD